MVWLLALVLFVALWAGGLSFKEAGLVLLIFAGIKFLMLVLTHLKPGDIIAILYLAFMVVFAATL